MKRIAGSIASAVVLAPFVAHAQFVSPPIQTGVGSAGVNASTSPLAQTTITPGVNNLSPSLGTGASTLPTIGTPTVPTIGTPTLPTIGTTVSPTIGTSTSPTIGTPTQPTIGVPSTSLIGTPTLPTIGTSL